MPHVAELLEQTDPKLRAYREEAEEREGRMVRTAKATAVLVGLITAVVVPLGGFAVWLLGEARAAGADAGRKLEEHQAESAQAHRQFREDVHEVQADVRAVYKAVMTRRPQPRLERPPDGGEQ